MAELGRVDDEELDASSACPLRGGAAAAMRAGGELGRLAPRQGSPPPGGSAAAGAEAVGVEFLERQRAAAGVEAAGVVLLEDQSRATGVEAPGVEALERERIISSREKHLQGDLDPHSLTAPPRSRSQRSADSTRRGVSRDQRG
ncbi:hypothetical protein WMF37_20780 [Sorangium sp. So ce291]|uniref:hypothetical protein n=1 Tax=Sorangium sp. So ce291 TaxID=3133294 RepID=UPI003F5F334F